MPDADKSSRRDFLRTVERPLFSGLPSREQWLRELIRVRAGLPGETPEGVVQFAEKIVKVSDHRHSIGFATPFGDVEILGADTAAVTWVIENLKL